MFSSFVVYIFFVYPFVKTSIRFYLYMCACAHVCILHMYMVICQNQMRQNAICTLSGQRNGNDSSAADPPPSPVFLHFDQ